MWSIEQNTSKGVYISIADQQQIVQTMWSTEQNTSRGVHKYCRSTTECSWMHSALYFTWDGHSDVDLHYLWTPLDAFCSVLHNYVRYRAECIQMCPHVLQINNGMSNPCEVQSRMHPKVSTSIADQQRNVYLWTTLDAFCSVPHMGWTFRCLSAIHVDTFGCILLCISHSLDILLLVCNTCGHPWMYSASRMHPGMSTSIADQQQNVQPMWSTEQNTSRGVHKYCRSTTECPTHVKYKAECIQECPQVLQITFCCWSTILVDTSGCILLCTSHGLDILLLICNTCGHSWITSIADQLVTSNYSSFWIHI
jgi:protein tyrosine phosphatase (PTP) superfamily phosphohydrolase (DUF442 family)